MISKRLRYEILRRDNHACRYCGRAAPDVALTIDHVIPVALGGTDEPGNLVTACADCNAGKTSTTPGAPLVDDVAADALRWAAAMKRAAELQQTERDRVEDTLRGFLDAWRGWFDGSETGLPDDWPTSLERMVQAGATPADLAYAVDVAMRSRVTAYRLFRYFCGVVYRLLADRQDIARSLLEES